MLGLNNRGDLDQAPKMGRGILDKGLVGEEPLLFHLVLPPFRYHLGEDVVAGGDLFGVDLLELFEVGEDVGQVFEEGFCAPPRSSRSGRAGQGGRWCQGLERS